jgi:hypothetical protein
MTINCHFPRRHGDRPVHVVKVSVAHLVDLSVWQRFCTFREDLSSCRFLNQVA